jgi:hypothetical protein
MPLATYLKNASSALPAYRRDAPQPQAQRPITVPSVAEAHKTAADDSDVIKISQWDAFLFRVGLFSNAECSS